MSTASSVATVPARERPFSVWRTLEVLADRLVLDVRDLLRAGPSVGVFCDGKRLHLQKKVRQMRSTSCHTVYVPARGCHRRPSGRAGRAHRFGYRRCSSGTRRARSSASWSCGFEVSRRTGARGDRARTRLRGPHWTSGSDALRRGMRRSTGIALEKDDGVMLGAAHG